MEVQGVVFYALTGDHPQAGTRKLRMGIAGTSTTLEAFRELLCRTHHINAAKFKIDIQSFMSRESLAPGTTLRNYDELRVVCTRRQMKDIVEEEELAEQSRAAAEAKLAEERVYAMLGEVSDAHATLSVPITTQSNAALRMRSSSSTTTNLQRMTTISKHRLPLMRKPLAHPSDDNAGGAGSTTEDAASCVLCGQPPSSSANGDDTHIAVPPCCHYRCCLQCYQYAGSLCDVAGTCPVCGHREGSAAHNAEGGPSSSTTVKQETHQPPLDRSGRGGYAMSMSGGGLEGVAPIVAGGVAKCDKPLFGNLRSGSSKWATYFDEVLPKKLLEAYAAIAAAGNIQDGCGAATAKRSREEHVAV